MTIQFVEPKVFLVGYSVVNMEGLKSYLEFTDQTDFLESFKEARMQGLSDAECLCSAFAKLCYKSLVIGKNDNITKVRDISDNIKGIHNTAHGSVLEHCVINFIATNVSRILTHELVRHRAGWAYSQTSGRYVRCSDKIEFVFDPILNPVKEVIEGFLDKVRTTYRFMEETLINAEMSMDEKKKITSAMRRIMPNGQSNEIGFSVNLRALRHFVMVRTSRHAEWEIRNVAEQVYDLVKGKFPLVFYGAKEEIIKGVKEITGMKLQPYEVQS